MQVYKIICNICSIYYEFLYLRCNPDFLLVRTQCWSIVLMPLQPTAILLLFIITAINMDDTEMLDVQMFDVRASNREMFSTEFC